MPKEYSWRRLFWYYTGYYDEYPTDVPTEEDVNKKQVLCKQVNLSKLKLNKVYIEPSVPFDLQKIKTNDKKVPLPLSDDIKPPKLVRQTNIIYDCPKPPPTSPIPIIQKKTKKITTKQESVRENEKEKRMSQKQKTHNMTYSDKLNLLKNI